MNKVSQIYAIFGYFILFSVISLVCCNASADNKAAVAEVKPAPMDTSVALFNADTSLIVKEAPTEKKQEIVTQINAAPVAVKPIAEKTPEIAQSSPTKQAPVDTKSSPSQQTQNVTPPPAILPITPKSPTMKSVKFSLKSIKAVIKGSSSLHSWESDVTKMEGKGSFELKDDALVAIKNVEIKMAVNGIKSKEGKKMDNKTYDTFHSDKYPNIIYSFSNAVVKEGNSNVVSIEASGKLAMAGNTQLVSLSASGKKLSNGDLQLSVSHKIKMTDYKMEPPVMLLGTIKVGDEITVEFDFVLEKVK